MLVRKIHTEVDDMTSSPWQNINVLRNSRPGYPVTASELETKAPCIINLYTPSFETKVYIQ